MKKIIFLTSILILLAIYNSYSQEDYIKDLMDDFELPEHTKGDIDIRYIMSKETETIFKIYIYMPLSYCESNEKYPVVFLTDAGYCMGIAQTTMDLFSMHKDTPELIFIGIDYPTTNMLEWARFRFRDMFPTHVEGWNPSGEADKFISMIEKELIPFIAENYRIDTTDKCFIGHSAGGSLGSHLILEKPDLFNRYIIGSPSYWWDNKELTNRLSKRDKIVTNKKTIIYTYVGEKEGDYMVNDWKEFNLLLKSKINENVEIHEKIYLNETHAGVIPAAFSTALKLVYKEK